MPSVVAAQQAELTLDDIFATPRVRLDVGRIFRFQWSWRVAPSPEDYRERQNYHDEK